MDQAMKTILLLPATLVLLLSYQHVNAQLWCPPGAMWTANFANALDGIEGCETAVYVGDTLYEGRMAQLIAVEDIIMDYPSGSLDTTYWNMYTSVSDSIVYQWTDSEGWDTLYWFSAVPGDRWYAPGMPPNGMDNCGMLEVSDTAHVMINGHFLRQVMCVYLDPSGVATMDVFNMTELFGTGSMHFPYGGCVVVEGSWGPHTYQDDAFPLFDNGAGSNCDHFSGIAENQRTMSVTAWPNPGSDVLHIETNALGKVDLRVRDVTGQAVLEVSGPSGAIELSSVGLLPGLYVVEVISAIGCKTVKWVKQ
jgi:hypothetical protein